MRNTLIVMVKEPHPGRVKTRLGAEIGMTRAAWWFRHQSARLLRRIEDPRWDVMLAVSPDAKGLASRVWPAHLPKIAQGRGDLGDRMGRLLRTFATGPSCVIGADVPGVQKPNIAKAFNLLRSCDAVFGPAVDGGYWLVGARKLPVAAFQNVRWSTEHALADTAASFKGARIGYGDTLADVDTAADLKNSPLGETR